MPRSPFFPLLLWLAPQLAVLALMAGQVPIVAPKAMPRPAELWALGMMTTVQVVTAALLFPYLLRDGRSTSLVVAASVPLGLLAAFLAGAQSKTHMGFAIGYVIAWLGALALWNRPLRTPRARAIGICLALLLALGAVVFWFVRQEYGPAGPQRLDLDQVEGLSPIYGAIAAGEYGTLNARGWVLISACLGSGLLAASLHAQLGRPAMGSHPGPKTAP